MSAALANHQFRLAARPVGMVKPGDWNSASESVREMTGGRNIDQGTLLVH